MSYLTSDTALTSLASPGQRENCPGSNEVTGETVCFDPESTIDDKPNRPRQEPTETTTTEP